MVIKRSRFVNLLYPFFVCCTYVFLYLPIIVIIMFSFNQSELSVRWTGFTLRWYREILNIPELLQSLKVSLIVALSATVLSIVMGTALVVALRGQRKNMWYNFFYANIIFPELIIAIGILSIFMFFRIPVGYPSLIVGHTIIGLGFVVPIVRARFLELDPVLTEASADLGATEFQTFWKIIVPLLVPALVASALLVFTLSLDDFLIAFFCSSPTVQTLSVYVFTLVRVGVSPAINAISTCLLVVSSIFMLLLCFFKVIDKVIAYE